MVTKLISKFHRFILLTSMLALLVACSAAPKREADRFYDLAVKPVTERYGQMAEIEVRPVTIKGVQSGRALIIQESASPLQLVEQRGHFWHSQPSYLLQNATISALNAGSSDAVFGTSESLKQINYRLKLSATHFAYAPNGEAIIAMDMSLQTKSGQVITSGSYTATAPINAPDIIDAVGAFGTATTIILQAIAADIAAAI